MSEFPPARYDCEPTCLLEHPNPQIIVVTQQVTQSDFRPSSGSDGQVTVELPLGITTSPNEFAKDLGSNCLSGGLILTPLEFFFLTQQHMQLPKKIVWNKS